MSKGKKLLEVKHLRKKFSDSEPLKDINCEIHEGEVISVIGPSGTGKSTFLRCINRLEKPTSGQIFFRGEEITDEPDVICPLRQKIGMVFQSFNLFSNMSIIENIITGPMLLKNFSQEEAIKKAMALLEMVGLSQKANSYPDELSGGQKQRIAIIRTLAMEPEVILFDEPTSALDPRMVDEVLAFIRALATKENYAMLIVTHEMRFAENVSNRIFFMNEGLIYEEGTPQEIFHAPRRDATKIFVNRLKTYEKTLDDAEINLSMIQAGIERFARDQFMSRRKSMILQLIFEEMVYGQLINCYKKIPVTMKIMYDDVHDECDVKISYGGEKFNPLEETVSVSLIFLEGIVQKSEYNFDGENVLYFRTV